MKWQHLTSSKARKFLIDMGDRAWVEMARHYGDNFWLGDTLCTCDEQLVDTLLNNRIHSQLRSRKYKFMAAAIPGWDGLLCLDGEKWQRQVRLVMPIFSKPRFDDIAEIADGHASEYFARWRPRQCLPDLAKAITALMDIIAVQIVYGLAPQSRYAQRLMRALQVWHSWTQEPCQRLDEFAIAPHKLLYLPWYIARLRRARANLQRILGEILASGALGSNNWLVQMAREGFSLTKIAEEAYHIYGAYDAISYITTCSLYELMRNRLWYRELQREFASLEGRLRSDNLGQLTTTGYVMRETMRMYPVSLGVARRTGATIEMPGGSIAPDTEILILLHALHHHPRLWPNAFCFSPERWYSDAQKRGFIPFLHGPRQCIGRHLAELLFATVLRALLSKWRLHLLQPDVRLHRFMIPRFADSIRCVIE